MMHTQEKRLTLTQEEIMQRRQLDAKFEAFMAESIADRKGIREELARSTRTLNEVHTALFARDDDNDLGITGLVPSMQRVMQHVNVTCGIAKFLKWSVISAGAIAAALIPISQILGWWGV